MIRWRSIAKEFTTEDTEGHREKKGRHIFVTGVPLPCLCGLCVKRSSARIAPLNTGVLRAASTPPTIYRAVQKKNHETKKTPQIGIRLDRKGVAEI